MNEWTIESARIVSNQRMYTVKKNGDTVDTQEMIFSMAVAFIENQWSSGDTRTLIVDGEEIFSVTKA